jgi:transcriptional regulator GlxA family with amidase domain
MEVAILLFDGVTALDAVGPYEVLRSVPGASIRFVAKNPGPQRTDSGFLALSADWALKDVTKPDVLLVPGGPGVEQVRVDEEVLDWVREVHQVTRWTTSVCTGALVLGSAGILEGLQATTHWMSYDDLASLGAKPTGRRVVEQGKVITAAGVSSGIDMALRLVQLELGDVAAQAIQLGIEYDPQPPFDAGSPTKAPAEVVELVRSVMSRGV